MASCQSRHEQKVYSIFSKSCPLGHQNFQKILKWKKVFIKMGSLPTVTTNSFRILVIRKFENIFTHIFSIFFGIGIYSFFRSINKTRDNKRHPKQVYLFHANADIKAKFYIFQEKHSQMKTFITEDRQKLPLVDPLS